MADNQDITIKQGSTFTLLIRWGTEPVIRKPITAISLASGAPRFEVAGHGLTPGWPAYVTRAKGMTQINAQSNPPRESDFHACVVIDADTIEFNDIDPVDDSGREWSAYTSGGFLCWNTPVDLAGQTGRMQIRDKVGGTVLASTEVTDAPLDVLHVTVDNALKTIKLTVAATDTDDLTWKTGVGELEMVSAGGTVVPVLSRKVAVVREVTKP